MAELIVDGLDAIVQLMTAVSDDDVGRIFWSGREVFLRGWREPDGFGWRFIWPVGNCPIGQLLAAVCTDHVFMLGTGLAGAIPGVLTTPFRRLLTVSGEDVTPAMSASSIYLWMTTTTLCQQATHPIKLPCCFAVACVDFVSLIIRFLLHFLFHSHNVLCSTTEHEVHLWCC
jgi:hypothetical protein